MLQPSELRPEVAAARSTLHADAEECLMISVRIYMDAGILEDRPHVG